MMVELTGERMAVKKAHSTVESWDYLSAARLDGSRDGRSVV
jgi:hypothetical protein